MSGWEGMEEVKENGDYEDDEENVYVSEQEKKENNRVKSRSRLSNKEDVDEQAEEEKEKVR